MWRHTRNPRGVRLMQMRFAPPLFVALIERLAGAHKASAERRMSVQVSGLADTVRRAKAAIDAAGGAAQRLNDSATAVVNTIGKVDDMTKQLDAANRDLNDAVAVMSNGGPPLVDTQSSAANSQTVSATDVAPAATVGLVASPNETIDSSIIKVQAAYVAPPVVTASTIFAEQQAGVAADAAHAVSGAA